MLFILNFAPSAGEAGWAPGPALLVHPWIFGQMWPQLWTYLHSGASMGLKLEQTDDASFQVGDQDVFCFIPIESFDLGGQEVVPG